VSPAPDTSYTYRAAAGICFRESGRRIAMPFSLSVTSMYPAPAQPSLPVAPPATG
jgi:hypothetical protein